MDVREHWPFPTFDVYIRTQHELLSGGIQRSFFPIPAFSGSESFLPVAQCTKDERVDLLSGTPAP